MSGPATLDVANAAIAMRSSPARIKTSASGETAQAGGGVALESAFQLELNAVEGLPSKADSVAGVFRKVTDIAEPSLDCTEGGCKPSGTNDLQLRVLEPGPGQVIANVPLQVTDVPDPRLYAPVSELLAQEAIKQRIVGLTIKAGAEQKIVSTNLDGKIDEVRRLGLSSGNAGPSDLNIELEAPLGDAALEHELTSRDGSTQAFEVGAIRVETHRKEIPVQSQAAALADRDGSQFRLDSEALTLARKDGSESRERAGQSNRGQYGGSSDARLSTELPVDGVRHEVETENSVRIVPSLDVPSISGALGEAADKLRSEATDIVQRSPTIVPLPTPVILKNFQMDVQCEHGPSVRLRLAMHEDGLEIALTSTDQSLMSMLSHDRDKLVSTLIAAGHNVAAVRFDAFEPPTASSLANDATFGNASGRTDGHQQQEHNPNGNRRTVDSKEPDPTATAREKMGFYV